MPSNTPSPSTQARRRNRLRGRANRSWSAAGSGLPAVADPRFSDEPPYDDDHVGESHPEINHLCSSFRAPHQLLVGVVPGVGAFDNPSSGSGHRSGPALLRDLRYQTTSLQLFAGGLRVVALDALIRSFAALSICANGWCWRSSWCNTFAFPTGGRTCARTRGTP